MFEAKEAARNAAGSVPWASLMGEEREDGQQQEPTGECDDWGLYHQTTDGPGGLRRLRVPLHTLSMSTSTRS